MENEFWLPVVGYEGIYEVSNIGRIKTLQRSKPGNPLYIITERIRPLQKHSNGYFSLILSKNKINKRVSVHRIVAEAFLPKPNGCNVVNHKNSIRDDNRVENLEWCTQSQNILHGTKRDCYRNNMQGKTGALHPNSKPVLQLTLDGIVVKKWDNAVDAAAFYNCHRSTLYSCLNGYNKTAVGFKWVRA